MKWVLIFFVRGYQVLLSPLLPPACRYTPSCSHYAIDALANHEVHVVLGGRMHRLGAELKLPLPKAGNEAVLHFGPLDRPHRMAVLRLYSEGA